MDKIIFYLALIIVSSFALIKAVNLFIKSSCKIAHSFRISEYLMNFLLISLATSLPELMIGISSATQGKSILSYGNVLGSNIALLTLIIAIPGFINSGLHTKKVLKSKDIYFSALFSLLAVALGIDGKLSRIDGGILLIGYFIYNIAYLRKDSTMDKIMKRLERKSSNLFAQGTLFIASLLIIIATGEVIVRAATGLSETLNIGLGFIGLSLMAIGTSLPEIAYSISLIKKGKQNETLGNVIGSVATNSTMILGVTSLISPIGISDGGINGTTYLFATLATFLFLGFSKSDKNINKIESFILLLVYILFISIEYLLQ